MLYLRFIFVLLLSVNVLQAQTQMTMDSRKVIDDLKESVSLGKFEENTQFYLQKYPVHYTQKGACLALLGKVADGFSEALLPKDVILGTQIGDIVTLKIPLNQLDLVDQLELIDYVEVSPKVLPELKRAVEDTRADSVHAGVVGNQSFTGKDVIIGVTDWGFDYTHPMFYDTALQQTRILASWDQFKRAGAPPNGFNYGTEHVGANDLLAVGSDTACTYYDYATHGSHVAGIAGGSGADLGFKGMAFESNFIFCQFYLDAAASIDAVQWMKDFAANEGKPLVINMSWGLYHLGPLDGTSLLSQAFNTFSDEGVIIVTSNGNNGNDDFHIEKDFNQDSIFSRIDFYPFNAHPSMWGQNILMWGESGHDFSAGIEVMIGSNLVAKSPFYSTSTLTNYVDSMFVLGSDTIFFNVSAEDAHPLNQRSYMRLRVKNKNTNFNVILKSFADDGTVHFWNVTELSNGAGNWGMPFSSAGPGSTIGDAEYGVGEPACTEKVISVAAHSSQVRLFNGTVRNGPLATFSSVGPTLDGRVKPDISAPGVNVSSSISSFTTVNFITDGRTTFNGKTYHFAKFSGTSMASPAAAGVVALMLEANPDLTPEQVKTILKQTARSDDETGVIPGNGSNEWGWGKINATAAVEASLLYSGLESQGRMSDLLVFPNPSNDLYRVNFGKDKFTGSVTVYDLNGREIYNRLLVEASEVEINAVDFLSGIYILTVQNDQETATVKLIKH